MRTYENFCNSPSLAAGTSITSLPTWADLEEFLEERCIPRQRAGLREYLEALGLEEYDPLAIIQKTKGRMAEDDQWMEVREIR